MKYVVICVYDREIIKVGQADNITEATEIMKNDFMNVFLEHYYKEDFENDYYRADEWELYDTQAWLNGKYDYDWRIIEVD